MKGDKRRFSRCLLINKGGDTAKSSLATRLILNWNVFLVRHASVKTCEVLAFRCGCLPDGGPHLTWFCSYCDVFLPCQNDFACGYRWRGCMQNRNSWLFCTIIIFAICISARKQKTSTCPEIRTDLSCFTCFLLLVHEINLWVSQKFGSYNNTCSYCGY